MGKEPIRIFSSGDTDYLRSQASRQWYAENGHGRQFLDFKLVGSMDPASKLITDLDGILEAASRGHLPDFRSQFIRGWLPLGFRDKPGLGLTVRRDTVQVRGLIASRRERNWYGPADHDHGPKVYLGKPITDVHYPLDLAKLA